MQITTKMVLGMPSTSKCMLLLPTLSSWGISRFIPTQFILFDSMARPISEVVLPSTNNIARELDEIYKDLHELDFISIEGTKTLEKKESLQKEKQISVDPKSLREPSMGEISFNMMLPPINAPPGDTAVPLPPPLLPAKHKFLSCSLPNSATSSPRFSSFLSRKNLKNESQASPRQVDKLVHKHSSAAQYHQALQKDNQFWRSKSCDEGRTCAPPDELDDLWLYNANALQYKNKHHGHGTLISNTNVNNDIRHKSSKNMDNNNEDDFKCSALCLFLPGFGKAKPVRPRKPESVVMENNVISRTVSLEKFECGSWASSTIIPDHDDDGDSMNLYFDLPLELIENLGNDAHLPVSAAFVFDKDIKGVLKNGSTSTRATGRKSHESSRHVRFSTSSPTSYPASPASCITPRLRKAREDFNAFLEAQSA
ncbi:PREDICTED: uncharacterized protein LOC18611620 [Theobroma cacao]|uniref:Uncharacterized protein LOC18611620 n=1 Tax=Theobroma cacao TaxID=3641 RepID=A0AB32VP89_THECC|nr:PREDICTED: uncharacterized protein LOC18611620 [Theobroma cacao]